jgi:hypothetical protein
VRETLIIGIDHANDHLGVSFLLAYEQTGIPLRPNLFLQLIWSVLFGRERR